jgi:hypothetical protein
MAEPQRKYQDPITAKPDYVTDFRNIKTRSDAANDNLRRPSNDNNPTTDELYVRGAQDRLTDPRKEREEQEQEERRAQKQAELEEFMAAAAYQEQVQVARTQQNQQLILASQAAQVKNKAQKGTAPSPAQLAQNTSTALWMTSWHVWFYLSFQLPLAILSLVLIGLQATIEDSWIASVLKSVVGSVASLFGKDISLIMPLSLSLALHFLLFTLCFFFLLITILTYQLRGQNPFGGDRSIGKMLALLSCFIGYTTPILNLFPWIGFYIYVMWRSK